MFRKWGMFALAKQGRLYLLALVKRPFMHCTFVIVIVSLQDCHHDTLVLAPLLIKKDKFYCPFFIFGWAVKRTKSTLDWVVVTYSDH